MDAFRAVYSWPEQKPTVSAQESEGWRSAELAVKHGITTAAAKHLPNGAAEHLNRLSKRIYKTLDLSGYARMDFV